MDAWNGTLLAVFVGMVYLILGFPLYRKRVKPNAMYGFRIRQTLDDPTIWYAVNARSGLHFIVTGAILLVLGVAAIVFGRTESTQNIVLVAALLIAVAGPLYTCVAGFRMAQSMATHNEQDQP